MAGYTEETKKYIGSLDGNGGWWSKRYKPGDTVEVSGIYRCEVCNKEITSNKDDPFPPQTNHSHSSNQKISWQLIVRADTKNEWHN